MIDWDDEIDADLCSGQPDRLVKGLHALQGCVEDSVAWELAPFGIELLALFETVPLETQKDFLSILTMHRQFSPPLTQDQLIDTMMALVLRYGETDIAYRVALELKIMENCIAATVQALRICFQQHHYTSKSVRGVAWLVSCLLDGKADLRAATLTELLHVAHTPFAADVVAFVLPEMTDEERVCFA